MFDHVHTLLPGIPLTLAITVAAFAIGAVVGFPLMLLRTSSAWLLRMPATLVIDLFRAVPPIAWLFILYYGIAQAVIKIDAFPAAALGLGVISSAYMAEIYRSGMLAVDRGQWEAGRAIGLSDRRVLTEIVGPQAFRVVVPPSATYVIGLLKDSAVASVIGVTEITYRANAETQATFKGLAVFLTAAAIYIIISLPLAGASRMLDARLRARVAR